jgi:hypothetical protein
MDGKCSLDAERFKAPLYVQVLAADAARGYRLVKKLPLSQRPIDCGAFVRDLGRTMPAKNWSEDQLEALRIEDEDGNIFVYSMYDRAREFFGVAALTVGQLPAFKCAVALGLVPCAALSRFSPRRDNPRRCAMARSRFTAKLCKRLCLPGCDYPNKIARKRPSGQMRAPCTTRVRLIACTSNKPCRVAKGDTTSPPSALAPVSSQRPQAQAMPPPSP